MKVLINNYTTINQFGFGFGIKEQRNRLTQKEKIHHFLKLVIAANILDSSYHHCNNNSTKRLSQL